MTEPANQSEGVTIMPAARQVTKPKPTAVASETGAIVQMIERVAMDPTIDISRLERLMDMHDKIIARNAKSAYMGALAAMQEELPVIKERGAIEIGKGKPQRYALWEDINEAIKPVLSRHGFALSFRTGQMDGKIIVTGILGHRDGHSEETTMHLPLDTSGSKNAVQAVGSSTSYGKRYTAAALLNLTSRGEDDDGKAGGDGPINEEQIEAIQRLIVEVAADIQKFCKYMKVARIEEIPAKHFDSAVAALEAKRAKS